MHINLVLDILLTILFTSILVLIVVFFATFVLVRVEGISMYPTYKSGEIVLARKLGKHEKFKDGKVYVFYPPQNEDDPNYFVIKRLFKHNIKGLYFLGDNLHDSYDSRDYGYVNSRMVKYVLVHSRRKCK